MKIAIFVSYLPPHVGGIEVVAESQMRALVDAGHEVSVITSACGASPGTSSLPGCSVRRIRAWNYFEKRMGAVFPLFSPTLLWHGLRAARKADVLHAHDAFYLTSLVAAVLARLLRKPFILTQHVDMVPHPSSMVNLAQRLVYATTGRYILTSSQKIIFLNSRVEKFLLGLGMSKDKIVYLPNGVDGRSFAPPTRSEKQALRDKRGLPADQLLALFVGRFVPKKGYEKLLRLDPLDNVDLVFVGGTRAADDTRGDHHFLGAVSHDDMPEIFRMCDIFVLPSEGEGFPVTVQEAMASGLPIILGDDPAYDPYGLDSSLVRLVRPDVVDISEALRLTSKDEDLRRNMAAYSREYALRHFDWGVNVAELLSLYSEAADSIKSIDSPGEKS